ncbi:MAG: DNA polymerase III subunit beta [Anaerolineae bacterium]|nr:DNA polymerase III subunit beta [Anaerolineae bacterium]
MRVTVKQEHLARGLDIVSRAVSSRSTLPILGNILLATDGGRLRLSATNLEIGINCWIGARVDDEGATTVPARLFTDLVKSLPPDQVSLEYVERNKTLNLRCMRDEAHIKGIDAADFPTVPTYEENGGLQLDADTFRQMVEQVSFAAAVDDSRPILTGVSAKFEPNKLTLAATDGFRLSVRTAELEHGLAQPLNVIIPARALAELARIAADQEEPIAVSIARNRNQILFHLANVDLVSQLIDGNFPDYNQIVPKSHNTRAVVDTRAFLAAAKRAALFARDGANIIRVKLEPGEGSELGQMTVSAVSTEYGDNVSQVDAAIEGQSLEIAFNAKYLQDALSVMDAQQVNVEMGTPSSPGVFKPPSGDFTHIVMPMHISR